MKRALLILAIVMGATLFAVSQEHPAQPAATTENVGQAPAEKKAEAQKTESPGQQLAHQSKEAEEGDESGQFKHSPTVRWVASKLGISVQAEYWVLYTIDFLIIALAVGWFWKSSIPSAFRARTASIRKTMDEAQATSADANRRLGDIEGRLAKLDQEIAQMRAQAESEAAAEESRIRAAAEADAHKIVEGAQAEIESSTRVAQRELKAYAAQLAVTLAEERMHVDANTDRQLVQRFSRDLATSERKETR
jgi:F-type H+-transporting ATPase subunit b